MKTQEILSSIAARAVSADSRNDTAARNRLAAEFSEAGGFVRHSTAGAKLYRYADGRARKGRWAAIESYAQRIPFWIAYR